MTAAIMRTGVSGRRTEPRPRGPLTLDCAARRARRK